MFPPLRNQRADNGNTSAGAEHATDLKSRWRKVRRSSRPIFALFLPSCRCFLCCRYSPASTSLEEFKPCRRATCGSGRGGYLITITRRDKVLLLQALRHGCFRFVLPRPRINSTTPLKSNQLNQLCFALTHGLHRTRRCQR